MSTYFPPLFLSHGAPNMGLHDAPVRDFMRTLAGRYPQPDAIISVSAHFETKGTAVVSDAKPEMIYDFRGFEPELHEMVYPASGHPELAKETLMFLKSAGINAVEIKKRGFDHGTWVPLSLVYPQADIPIVQVSIDPDETPEYHFKLGQALASLAERNIAIIGTGNITHNLPALFSKGRDPELDANIKGYVEAFLKWFDDQLESNHLENLLNYRNKAPFAEENHPTDEHLLPIFVALGAANGPAAEKVKAQKKARKIHASYNYDFLAMDAWEFGLNWD